MIGVDVSFRDPNSFASTLLLALVMTLPLWRLAKTSTARLPLLAFTGAACLCILLTGSRTGFMGLGVVGGFSLLVSRANKLVFVALVVAALVIAASLPSYLQERFLTIVDPSHGPANAQESMHGRIVGFLAGLELFDQNPIIGVGPGAFPYATGTGFNPHNLPGQLLSEMGLLGAVTFLAFLGCFYLNWREVGKAYRRHPEWGYDMPFQVTRSVGLSVVLLLLLGLAGHNLYRYIWIWLAAFQAIAVHCVRQRVAAEAAAPMRARVAYVRGPRRVGYYLPAAARRPSA
jgi:O-antigen ligase